jgi:ketosteroid isomerase-like protein
MKPEEVALQFIAAINDGDIEVMGELMTEDHLFIDAGDTTGEGRQHMKEGWKGYYAMVPDYRCEVTETFVSGNIVVLLGRAMGTYSTDGNLRPENYWNIPAAWRAVIEGNQVKQWQVYADNEPMREIMARNAR